MIVSSTLVSVLSVLLVAIDRFLFILYGLQYQRYIFPNRARILIVTTWIIGELLAVLKFLEQTNSQSVRASAMFSFIAVEWKPFTTLFIGNICNSIYARATPIEFSIIKIASIFVCYNFSIKKTFRLIWAARRGKLFFPFHHQCENELFSFHSSPAICKSSGLLIEKS